MRAEIQNALAILTGKALWGCGRAADLATFQFGERVARIDFFGKPSEVGEYALHVQCAWRIAQKDQLVVGAEICTTRPTTAMQSRRS